MAYLREIRGSDVHVALDVEEVHDLLVVLRPLEGEALTRIREVLIQGLRRTAERPTDWPQ